MIQKKSEDAVSPVIGVMLLLVVTIVIAAVVAVFASGVGADAEPAPTTVLDVVDICDEGHSEVQSPGPITTTKWKLVAGSGDENDLIYGPQGIAFYYANKGEDSMEIIENKIFSNSGESVEFNGHQLRYKDGIWYVGGDAIVHSDDYVYPDKVDSAGFDAIRYYCTKEIITADGIFKPVIVTIDCLAGDILNKEKLSIKVYDSNGVLAAVKNQNSLSGTLNPGDTLAIQVDELLTNPYDSNDFNAVVEGDKVEVFVLYGEHVIVSKEMKVSGP